MYFPLLYSGDGLINFERAMFALKQLFLSYEHLDTIPFTI